MNRLQKRWNSSLTAFAFREQSRERSKSADDFLGEMLKIWSAAPEKAALLLLLMKKTMSGPVALTIFLAKRSKCGAPRMKKQRCCCC